MAFMTEARASIIFLSGIAVLLAAANAHGQSSGFLPKHLAVLRAGDGNLDLHLRQSPVFIDQFAPDGFNASPSLTVSIPTNGPDTLFFNGHAATEGILTRSPDHRLLTLAGYGGVSLLESNGTPSLLDIARVFCSVDAHGKVRTFTYRKVSGMGKMNPRGVVTDGTNDFWGCGNALGTVYYRPDFLGAPVAFAEAPNSRSIGIFGGALYVSLNGPDGEASGLPAGIFSFIGADGRAAALPRDSDARLKVVVAAKEPHTRLAGFDLSPDGTAAYVADTVAGIEKYVKSGGTWKFAYNFSVPQNIPADHNRGTGCFGVTADFSGSAPVVYATTTDGYGGCVNSNRVVRVVDTGAAAAVTTIAQAGSTNLVYRGIAWTPEP